MSTATATRPRPATAPSAAGPAARPRAAMRTALLSLVAAGVVAGGTWGLLSPRDSVGAGHTAHGAAAALATVDLSDGTLRVDGLVDKQVGHVMPGMSVAKDVPPGMRRLAVNVSLGATEDGALTYASRDFTVFGPGVKPVAPVDGQLRDGTLTPGTEISGSLSFDVPKETTSLSLRFRDTEAVPLPELPPVADGQHAEAGAPAGAPAPEAGAGHHDAPAPAPKAGADHEDAPGAPAHGH